jgi:hypothetical protein
MRYLEILKGGGGGEVIVVWEMISFYLFIYLISNQNLQLFYKLMC